MFEGSLVPTAQGCWGAWWMQTACPPGCLMIHWVWGGLQNVFPECAQGMLLLLQGPLSEGLLENTAPSRVGSGWCSRRCECVPSGSPLSLGRPRVVLVGSALVSTLPAHPTGLELQTALPPSLGMSSFHRCPITCPCLPLPVFPGRCAAGRMSLAQLPGC